MQPDVNMKLPVAKIGNRSYGTFLNSIYVS